MNTKKEVETMGIHPNADNAEELEFAPVEDFQEQESVVEAVLFTMGSSVELRQLAAAIGQPEDCAKKAALRLKEKYEKEKRGIQVIELENSFQLCTRTEYYRNLIRVAAAPRRQVLTDVVLETLSIIAYQQPITKLEIEKIRGVKSDHAVNKLIEYNLVCEVGRLDAPGRPVLFGTTEEFLRRFGIGSSSDLPGLNPEQEEEIKSEVEAELNMTREELEMESRQAAKEEAPEQNGRETAADEEAGNGNGRETAADEEPGNGNGHETAEEMQNEKKGMKDDEENSEIS